MANPFVHVELSSTDVAATRKAQALGAKVMKDVTEVPDMGWFSVIVDPTGAALGLWKSKMG